MKKFLAVLCALAVLAPAVSCGKKENDPQPPKQDDPVEVTTLSLKSATVNMAEEFTELIAAQGKFPDILLFGQREDGSFGGCYTSRNFAEKKAFDFVPDEGGTVRAAAMVKWGKTAVLTVGDGNTALYVVDIDGTVSDRFDLGELIGDSDVFVEMAADESGFYINISRSGLVYVSADGVKSANVNVGGRNIAGISCDSSGCPTALLTDGDDVIMATLSDGEVSAESWCGDAGSAVFAVGSGRGDYRLTANIGGILYGLADGKMARINDFTDFPFNPQAVSGIFMTDDREFAVRIRSDKDGTTDLLLLSERDISEIKERTVLKMAVLREEGAIAYDEKIKKFNSESEDIKLETVCYGSPYTNSAVTEELRNDLLTGNAPDIIMFDENLPIGTFGARDSLFVNYYDLMADDPDYSPEDFVDGFLAGLEYKGKLHQLCGSFNVNTLTMKKKFAGGLTSWDLDQFVEVSRSLPEGMELLAEMKHAYRWSMFHDFVNYSAFVDYDSAVCRFDSPEFVRTLSFFNENNIGVKSSAADDSWMSEGFDSEQLSLRFDKVLLSDKPSLQSFRDYRRLRSATFGEDIVCIGYPTSTGLGSYAMYGPTYGIFANSPYIAECWDFLKFYIFDVDELRYSGFSGLESRLTTQLAEEKVLHTYTDPDTGEERNADLATICYPDSDESITVEFDPLSDEEAAELDRLVRGALKAPVYNDRQLWMIIFDEIESCFEGERTAEEAAAIIQNRASIYLSENYA